MNIKRGSRLVVGLFFVATIGSTFANTDCSSATGNITYREHSYGGGARPPADYEIGRTEWMLSGTVLFLQIQCTPSNVETPTRGQCSKQVEVKDADLDAHFVEGSERVLYESPRDEPWHHIRKYVVEALVQRPSGLPLPDGRLAVQDFLICEESRILAP